MIQLTPQLRICLHIPAIDFRCGIDTLSSLCQKIFGVDPFCGYLFVFRNRHKNAIKILVYDGSGFWLCHKRLSKGRLRWWPSNANINSVSNFPVYQLQAILSDFVPEQGFNQPFRQVLQP